MVGKFGREADIGEADLAVGNIDVEFGLRGFFDQGGESADVASVHDETRHAEGDGVTEENFGEALGQDGTEAVAVEGLRGVLAGAAAAEVAPGQKDGGAGVFGVVDRVGLGLAIRVEALVVEGIFTKAVKRDALHVTCGDDAVGVDIITGNVNAGAGDLGDFS